MTLNIMRLFEWRRDAARVPSMRCGYCSVQAICCQSLLITAGIHQFHLYGYGWPGLSQTLNPIVCPICISILPRLSGPFRFSGYLYTLRWPWFCARRCCPILCEMCNRNAWCDNAYSTWPRWHLEYRTFYSHFDGALSRNCFRFGMHPKICSYLNERTHSRRASDDRYAFKCILSRAAGFCFALASRAYIVSVFPRELDGSNCLQSDYVHSNWLRWKRDHGLTYGVQILAVFLCNFLSVLPHLWYEWIRRNKGNIIRSVLLNQANNRKWSFQRHFCTAAHARAYRMHAASRL